MGKRGWREGGGWVREGEGWVERGWKVGRKRVEGG